MVKSRPYSFLVALGLFSMFAGAAEIQAAAIWIPQVAEGANEPTHSDEYFATEFILVNRSLDQSQGTAEFASSTDLITVVIRVDDSYRSTFPVLPDP